MKTIYRLFIGAAVLSMASLTLSSCDEVAEKDRYIEGEAITAERGVLLEDFTGQNCVNCPDAHEVIEVLEKQYGSDKVIAVSIHSGPFAISVKATNFDKNRIGLMTDEGSAIMQEYSISQFPMGVINMTGDPMTHDKWANAVENALKETTDVNIELKAEYVPGDTDGENGYSGTIKANATVLSGSPRTVNFQFWIVENGIVAQQKNVATTIPDYIHNNVFRAQVFEGAKGKSYTLTEGIEQEIAGTIETRWTNKERWEVKNLSVIAFASDATGVLQVVKVPLFKDETESEENSDSKE